MISKILKVKIFLLLILISATSFAQSPVPAGAKVEKLHTGFLQVEGPVWYDGPGLKSATDSTLLFSDIAGNKIYQYDPKTGIATPFLNPSDSSNGMTFDHQGRLVFCQMGFRRVVRMDSSGTITPLASTYQGKKFNSPNDVVVRSDGSIFFTDPPFNVPSGQSRELSFAGIYRISPAGSVRLLDSSLSLPNGICFSNDESKLYINDSQARIVYVWDVVDDSVLANKQVFATIRPTGYADGMKFDSSGNLFCAGPLGVWVFSSNGSCVDTILIPSPDVASNCNWGDHDRKTLYITAGKTLYRIRLANPTSVKTEGNNIHKPSFRLFPNFPNPFNPTTAISYQLATMSRVTLRVYDLLGREVGTLVNEIEEAGAHEVKFDGSRLSSGIYFYRLSTGSLMETKAMVLLK
ncbi:MAG TPA: SMP-30/gluconolactonase/LRE family protein [Candidatus Acidoferrales bacterium]|nr:SMP-30/gluconolactonase/LRE family protein [Candidatus Acidoferrales bacterium]